MRALLSGCAETYEEFAHRLHLDAANLDQLQYIERAGNSECQDRFDIMSGLSERLREAKTCTPRRS